jgi:hypothetical protein
VAGKLCDHLLTRLRGIPRLSFDRLRMVRPSILLRANAEHSRMHSKDGERNRTIRVGMDSEKRDSTGVSPESFILMVRPSQTLPFWFGRAHHPSETIPSEAEGQGRVRSEAHHQP